MNRFILGLVFVVSLCVHSLDIRGEGNLSSTSSTGRQAKSVCTLDGTWKLISGKYGDSETLTAAGPDRVTLKFVSSGHFTWFTYKAESGEIYRMGGGSYLQDGNNYTEILEYGLDLQWVEQAKGQQNIFTCRVEGDKWYHSGSLANGFRVEEVWQWISQPEGTAMK